VITLTKFLLAAGVGLNVRSYTMHLATNLEDPPLDAFFDGRFKEWQEHQSQKNFSDRKHIVSLIKLRRNRWLFAGVFEVLGKPVLQPAGHVLYNTQMLPEQDKLIGRLVVEHKRTGRASFLRCTTLNDENFQLKEVLPEKLAVEAFPGHHAIDISYAKLKIVIRQSPGSWHGALANLKGVYLISDTATGRLYVGSACGNEGIWQRWSQYAKNGHGGNTDLKAVLTEKGAAHAAHFRYSLLEFADSIAQDSYVLQRESYWKGVLLSRTFGYNRN
jgi:hypothetical protein